MSYTVKHGTANDGPKHTEFENENEAKTFAESVGGKVLRPAPVPAPPKNAVK